jgi:hypothetical protein
MVEIYFGRDVSSLVLVSAGLPGLSASNLAVRDSDCSIGTRGKYINTYDDVVV